MTTRFEEFVALPQVEKIGPRDAMFESPSNGILRRVYYRFLDDERALLTHRMEESWPEKTLVSAMKVLDFAEIHAEASWGTMKRISGLECGISGLDHLLTVPPIYDYVSFFNDDGRLIPQRLYCTPIHACEFTDDETKPEYLGRRKLGFPFSKWNREPVPGVSTTFNIMGGPKSRQRRPAVTRYTDLQKYVTLAGEKGGVVVVENYERERCVFESDTPNGDLSVVFRRETHSMRAKEALAFLEVLARKGGDAAAETL